MTKSFMISKNHDTKGVMATLGDATQGDTDQMVTLADIDGDDEGCHGNARIS